MKGTQLGNEHRSKVSRRAILKTASAAAMSLALGPSTNAKAMQPALPAGGSQIDYGKGDKQTHLDSTNIFPLLAAWLLLTTNGPAETVDKGTIVSVANLSDASTDAILKKFTQNKQSFKDVRAAFRELALDFATVPPYSGGQCPEKAATIAPVAALPCH